MISIALYFLILTVSCRSTLDTIPVKDDANIRITFGSCKDHKKMEAFIFDEIAKEGSDVFIWSGDVVYVDSYNLPFTKGFFDPDEKKLRKEFEKSKNDIYY